MGIDWRLLHYNSVWPNDGVFVHPKYCVTLLNTPSKMYAFYFRFFAKCRCPEETGEAGGLHRRSGPTSDSQTTEIN